MTLQYTDQELMTWRPAKNTGSAIIYPRQVVMVADGNDLDRSIVAVEQPKEPMGHSYAVNGPTAIQPGKFGRVCFGRVVLVEWDSEKDDPVLDSMWQPEAGQGQLVPGGSEFRCLRIVDEDNSLMLALVPAGSVERIFFTLTSAITSGGYATAAWKRWDSSANSGKGGYVSVSNPSTITVIDPCSMFPTSGTAPVGTKGFAERRPADNSYDGDGYANDIVDLDHCTGS